MLKDATKSENVFQRLKISAHVYPRLPVRGCRLAEMRQDFSDAFAAVVKRHRLAKGLSKATLAQKTGLHQTYVGLLEWGLRNPTLDTQINSFCCGVAAGFSVVKTFHKAAEFEEFYDLVDPDQEIGTSTVVLRKALRQSGISIKSPRLTYKALLGHIRAGRPVIVAIQNPGSESRHWVVAYGFGPDHIILASNGVPWVHKKRIPRTDFISMWDLRQVPNQPTANDALGMSMARNLFAPDKSETEAPY